MSNPLPLVLWRRTTLGFGLKSLSSERERRLKHWLEHKGLFDWRMGMSKEVREFDEDEAFERAFKLEKAYAGFICGDYVHGCKDQFEQDQAAYAALQAENKQLREALEFYADPAHWTIEWVEGSHGDYGSRAREALKEREG